MAYRKFRRTAHATPRDMVIRYAGKCACCGAMIPAGAYATYYPPGTISGVTEGHIAHVGGLDGNSQTCTAELRKASPELRVIAYTEAEARRQRTEATAVNAYAGDGLDARYEDDCAAVCGPESHHAEETTP